MVLMILPCAIAGGITSKPLKTGNFTSKELASRRLLVQPWARPLQIGLHGPGFYVAWMSALWRVFWVETRGKSCCRFFWSRDRTSQVPKEFRESFVFWGWVWRLRLYVKSFGKLPQETWSFAQFRPKHLLWLPLRPQSGTKGEKNQALEEAELSSHQQKNQGFELDLESTNTLRPSTSIDGNGLVGLAQIFTAQPDI